MPVIAKFRIVVRNGTDALVRPPSDVCEKIGATTQEVWIKNMTGGQVLVSLPGGVFDTDADGVADPPDVKVIPAAGAGNPLKLPVLAGAAGIFSFKAFCRQTFSFAQGNSDPEFIIEN